MDDTPQTDGQSKRFTSVGWLRGRLPGLNRRIAGIAAASMVAGILEAGVLVVIARLGFGLSEGQDRIDLVAGSQVTIGEAVALALAGVSLRLLFGIGVARSIARAMGDALRAVRRSLLRAFIQADWSAQSRQRLGNLQDLMTTHADRAAAVVASLAGIVGASLNLGTFILVAVFVDVRAALAIVLAGGLLVAAIRPITGTARRSSAQQSDTGRLFAGTVAESAAMAREITLFDAGEAVESRLSTRSDEHARFYARSRMLGLVIPQAFQSAALAVLVVGIGIVSSVGSANLPDVGAVVLLLLRAMSYGQQLQHSVHGLHDGAPFIEHLAEAQAEFVVQRRQEGRQPMGTAAEITLRGVNFEYLPGRPVLHDLDLAIPSGEMLGVIGPSGGGKSTLLQVLLRLRAPTGGRYEVDGIAASEIREAEWARAVAFVPQEPHLFTGTVAENIDFFRDLSREQIEAAARSAGLHEEIAQLELGYDEPVGEEGVTLSGGQQQRLCIARALAGGPVVLVLDEPTSALDPRSEQKIQDSLAGLQGSITMVVVAHRLTTVASCDRVLVLADGSIQASGRHNDLLATSPYYTEALRLSTLDSRPEESSQLGLPRSSDPDDANLM